MLKMIVFIERVKEYGQSHFKEVTVYRSEAKFIFLKLNQIHVYVYEIFLASTILFPKFLFSKLIALVTSENSKMKLVTSVE